MQPTEDTEEGRQDIDTENGPNQLPGRISLTTTGDEDEPILGQRDFQEEDFLNVAEVLDDTAVGHVESATDDPCTNGEQESESDGNDPDLGQLPLNRLGYLSAWNNHKGR